MRLYALLVLGSFCVAAVAQAQSPIPDQRVPGFGGTNSGIIANSPSAVGSDVGSNVGAGANAGPNNDIIAPPNTGPPSDLDSSRGTTGSLTITR